MKSKPDELWKRLLRDASPPAPPMIDDDDVTRIVSQLRWHPDRGTVTWEETLWPLLLRFALPGAALILILASTLPAPDRATPSDSVDDLIAALLPTP